MDDAGLYIILYCLRSVSGSLGRRTMYASYTRIDIIPVFVPYIIQTQYIIS